MRDVILVTIDTLRFDAVGFDGNSRQTSPNLDRLAADGRAFEFAHAHNVMTLPSHTNILTGLYPYQHGVRDNTGFRLGDNTETAATRFASGGFATGAFVSAFTLDSRYGLARGFETYGEIYPHTHEPEELEVPEGRAPDTVTAALNWYQKNAGRRRFLWVHVYDPHAPYDPPEPWRTRFANDPYLGEVAFADSALGPLLDAVRATRPPPFLVVTGDHGEARGDHGELTHGLFAYEATLHVPLLLWSPGLVAPGRDERPARHIDILPTMLAAAGLPNGKLPGASLLGPTPEGRAAASYFESLSASFNRGWAPLTGLILERTKYIDLPVQELYDLRSDSGERHNLAAGATDELRVFRSQLQRVPANVLSPSPVSSEEAERLRSLGYLSGGSQPRASGTTGDPKNLIGVDNQLQRTIFLYQTGKLGDALALARQIIAANPTMSAGYQQLIFLLRQSGNLAEALETYDKAAANGVGDESMDRSHAIVLCDAGLPQQAVSLLQQYAAGTDTETLNALGIALSDAGHGDQALEVFRRAIARDPQDSLTYQNQGVALLNLGRNEAARQSLERAVSISDRNPRAWNTLGVVWMHLGQPNNALTAWRRALRDDAKQYDALYNIGIVEARLGDRAAAQDALDRFLASAPASRFAAKLAKARSVLEALRER